VRLYALRGVVLVVLGAAVCWPTALGASPPPTMLPGCASTPTGDAPPLQRSLSEVLREWFAWMPSASATPTVWNPAVPGGPFTGMLIAALRREAWQPHWAWNAMVDAAFRVRGNPTVLQLVGGVMFCESRFNRWARGDPPGPTGLSRGLYQIHRGFWPEVSDAQAFNPAWAIRWAVPKLLGVGGSPYLWSCFRERLILQ